MSEIVNAVTGRIDVLPDIYPQEPITSASFNLFDHTGPVTVTISISSGPPVTDGPSWAVSYSVKVRIDGEQVYEGTSLFQAQWTWTDQLELAPGEHIVEIEMVPLHTTLRMSCQVSYLPYTMLIVPVTVVAIIGAATWFLLPR